MIRAKPRYSNAERERAWSDHEFYEVPDNESAMDEVESQAKRRKCPCGKMIRGLRALHGKRHCSGKCSTRYL